MFDTGLENSGISV